MTSETNLFRENIVKRTSHKKLCGATIVNDYQTIKYMHIENIDGETVLYWASQDGTDSGLIKDISLGTAVEMYGDDNV